MSDNINTTDNVCHDEIAELLSELHLNAPLPFLRDVKKCLIAEHIAPSDDIIKFFDAIYTVSSSRAENITVSKMFSDDKEIVKSFSDVYKKSEYLHSKLSTPLSVCDVLPTASAYLKTLGITPPKTVSIDKKNDLRILLENGNRLVDISFDKESPLPYGYVDEATFRESKKASDTSLFVPENTQLLLATSDESSFDALCNDERFKEISVASREIDSRGVLYAIISLAFGATVDLGALSCGEESLVDLIYAAHDEHVIAVPPSMCEEVTELASIYGVSLKNLAITTKEPSVKFNYHFGEISIRAGFLRRLFEYKTESTPKMSAEEFTLTEYEPLFYTRDGKDRQQLDGTVIAKGHIVSARYTSECSFTNGINTVLDTVFSLLAKGIDVRDIGITLKIGAKSHDSAFAATLGAYRVIMELCLPEISSEVALSSDDHIFCTAFARLDENKELIPDKFVGAQDKNAVYLASFKRFFDTSPAFMPDFSELREMCKFLRSAANEGNILSSRAVNACVLSAARDMCDEETELLSANNDGISESTNAQGFVIEVKADSKINAPLIGYLNIKNDETDLYRGTTYASKW